MAIPTDGLVLHYTMNRIVGSTVLDEMGNYNGVIVGNTQVMDGVDGNALGFQGGYIDTGYKTNGGDYTIVARVRRFSINTQDAIYAELGATGDSHGALLMFLNSNSLYMAHARAITGGVNAGEVLGPVSDPFDYNICACVRKNGEYHRLYFNNSMIADLAFAVSITGESTHSGKVGGNPDFNNNIRALDGSIDQFLIYDRALTHDELTNISFPPKSISIDINGGRPGQKWNVHSFQTDGVIAGPPIVTGSGSLDVVLPWSGAGLKPCYVTVMPDMGDVWRRNNVVSVDQYCFPLDPVTTPYYFKCSVAGTTGSTEPAWNVGSPGAYTNDGTAQWELVERMVQPITHGPLMPE